MCVVLAWNSEIRAGKLQCLAKFWMGVISIRFVLSTVRSYYSCPLADAKLSGQRDAFKKVFINVFLSLLERDDI